MLQPELESTFELEEQSIRNRFAELARQSIDSLRSQGAKLAFVSALAISACSAAEASGSLQNDDSVTTTVVDNKQQDTTTTTERVITTTRETTTTTIDEEFVKEKESLSDQMSGFEVLFAGLNDKTSAIEASKTSAVTDANSAKDMVNDDPNDSEDPSLLNEEISTDINARADVIVSSAGNITTEGVVDSINTNMIAVKEALKSDDLESAKDLLDMIEAEIATIDSDVTVSADLAAQAKSLAEEAYARLIEQQMFFDAIAAEQKRQAEAAAAAASRNSSSSSNNSSSSSSGSGNNTPPPATTPPATNPPDNGGGEQTCINHDQSTGECTRWG